MDSRQDRRALLDAMARQDAADLLELIEASQFDAVRKLRGEYGPLDDLPPHAVRAMVADLLVLQQRQEDR